MKLTSIGSFLKRSKIPIDIDDTKEYKRVTIKIKHNGVSRRDVELGKKIGTKKQFILKAGQFIVSKIDARYGAFGIAPDSVDGAIITGNFWAYDVDFSQLNIEWFNQYTNSPAFYELCERASAGITHRKYLNETFFLNYQIQLPTIEEQLIQIDEIKKQKISFNKLTSELATQLSLVKELRQAFLSEAMQGKLVLAKDSAGDETETGQQLLARIKAEKAQLIKDKKLKKEKELSPIKPEEIPFEIPKDWVWCKIGEVSIIKGGKRVPLGYSLTRNPTQHVYLRVSDMKNGGIDDSDLHYIDDFVYEKIKQYTISENDIYMTIVGGTIGKCGLIPSRFNDMNLTENAAKVMPLLIDKNYLLKCLQSPFCQNQFIDKTKQVGVQKMALNRFSNSLLPLPPLSIQRQIVAKLDELMKTCDDLESSIKQSQIQNEQLLQQVLKEALEIREKPAQSVKLSIPENRRNFAKQVLGGKIISLFKDDPNFTHIKLQKLQYLSEHIAEADLGSDYYFQSAGPYDNKFMHSIAISLERSKWFKEENYRYYPLEKVDQIDQYYEGYFAPVSDKLSNLFNLLANATEAFSEIIATLYAVWNNRIIKKENISVELIVQDFYNWSDRKHQYKEQEVSTCLQWLNDNEMRPIGFGKLIKIAKRK